MVLNLEVETDVVYIDLAYSLSKLRFFSFFSALFFSPYFLYFFLSPVHTVIVNNITSYRPVLAKLGQRVRKLC